MSVQVKVVTSTSRWTEKVKTACIKTVWKNKSIDSLSIDTIIPSFCSISCYRKCIPWFEFDKVWVKDLIPRDLDCLRRRTKPGKHELNWMMQRKREWIKRHMSEWKDKEVEFIHERKGVLGSKNTRSVGRTRSEKCIMRREYYKDRSHE